MKIVVCIKQVPATGADKRYTDDLRLDRTGVEAIINPLDEYAIEQALRLLDDGSVESVTYLSMGPEQAAEALRRALAMGGDEAVLVTDPALAGADEWATARVLAAALDKLAPDVALMGMASDDARGSLVPGAVAAMRELPLLSYGSELKVADGEARIRRLSADRLRLDRRAVAGRGQRHRPGGGAALCQPEGDHGRQAQAARDVVARRPGHLGRRAVRRQPSRR